MSIVDKYRFYDRVKAQLYDLESNRAQTTNGYREHPEVVKELLGILDTYLQKASKSKEN